MTNNIQMFQYNGLEYNQLNPSLSNLSNNSNQLGGIESSQWATKEYVDTNLSFRLKYIDNLTAINQLSNESMFQDILKAKGIIIEYKINLTTENNSQYHWSVNLKIGSSLSTSDNFGQLIGGYKNEPSYKAIERSMFFPKIYLTYGSDNTTQDEIYAQYVDYNSKYGINSVPVLRKDDSNTYLYNKFFLTTINVSSITIDYCKLGWLM